MKKFLLIIFLCAGPMLLPAQPWRISGYKDTVAITIINEGKEAKVQRGSTAATFPLHTEGKLLRLKTSGENERLMRIVNVDITKVDQEFKALDGSLMAGEKLINRANAFVGKKLMIVPEGYAGGVEDSAYEEVNNNGEAGGVNEPQDQQASGNLWKDNWLYLLLAALVGAILSALVTRAITGNKNKTRPAVVHGHGIGAAAVAHRQEHEPVSGSAAAGRGHSAREPGFSRHGAGRREAHAGTHVRRRRQRHCR